jgi:lipid-A-disaccharide synthase
MRVGIVVGEASGDILGADLMAALQQKFPHIQFEGVAGPLMAAQGCKVLVASERLAVMGLFEVLGRLPELLSIRRYLKRYFLSNAPDVFVGVDAPDFNLPLEKYLRERGVLTVHYVSPSVWAWRQGRVKFVARCVNLLLTLLPFEAAFYRDHGVPVQFVGHTLADQVPLVEALPVSARAQLGMAPDGPVVAVLPGSRMSEVARLAPVFMQTMVWLQARIPGVRFIAPMATPRVRAHVEQLMRERALPFALELVDNQARLAMQAADVVLVASGTATLEAMLMKRPMVMAYKLSPLTYGLVRLFNLVKIRTFSLPNLIAGERLVPEFIQNAATPEALGQAVAMLLQDESRRRSLIARFGELHRQLRCNASERAAEAIVHLINSHAHEKG